MAKERVPLSFLLALGELRGPQKLLAQVLVGCSAKARADYARHRETSVRLSGSLLGRPAPSEFPAFSLSPRRLALATLILVFVLALGSLATRSLIEARKSARPEMRNASYQPDAEHAARPAD